MCSDILLSNVILRAYTISKGRGTENRRCILLGENHLKQGPGEGFKVKVQEAITVDV